jgi:2-polyprenyl-3-methyl-5-hydroxy-6-metoxy-1,4-benzoquinol methylase
MSGKFFRRSKTGPILSGAKYLLLESSIREMRESRRFCQEIKKGSAMASIQDDRGYNQGYKPTQALEVRTKRRCDYILEKVGLPSNGRILEIGCGTGQISYLLANRGTVNVVGVDLCSPFIEEARKTYQHPKLSYEVFDFNSTDETLLTQLGKVDAIVGNGILHHLYYNLDPALQRFKRLCKPGARFVFLEPNLLNPYCFLIFTFGPLRKLAKLEPDEMAFTRNFIRSKLSQNGFSNHLVEYKDFLLPNTPAPLIRPVITIGDYLEKIPGLNCMAQSLFISGSMD